MLRSTPSPRLAAPYLRHNRKNIDPRESVGVCVCVFVCVCVCVFVCVCVCVCVISGGVMALKLCRRARGGTLGGYWNWESRGPLFGGMAPTRGLRGCRHFWGYSNWASRGPLFEGMSPTRGLRKCRPQNPCGARLRGRASPGCVASAILPLCRRRHRQGSQSRRLSVCRGWHCTSATPGFPRGPLGACCLVRIRSLPAR